MLELFPINAAERNAEFLAFHLEMSNSVARSHSNVESTRRSKRATNQKPPNIRRSIETNALQ